MISKVLKPLVAVLVVAAGTLGPAPKAAALAPAPNQIGVADTGQTLELAQQWVLTAQAWSQRALQVTLEIQTGMAAVPPEAFTVRLHREVGRLVDTSYELYSVWESLSGDLAMQVADNPQDTYLAYLDQLLRSQLLSMDILARLFRKMIDGEVVAVAEFELTQDVAKLWQGISSVLILQLQDRTGVPFLPAS